MKPRCEIRIGKQDRRLTQLVPTHRCDSWLSLLRMRGTTGFAHLCLGEGGVHRGLQWRNVGTCVHSRYTLQAQGLQLIGQARIAGQRYGSKNQESSTTQSGAHVSPPPEPTVEAFSWYETGGARTSVGGHRSAPSKQRTPDTTEKDPRCERPENRGTAVNTLYIVFFHPKR